MHVSRSRRALLAVTSVWAVTSLLIACSSNDSGGSSPTGGGTSSSTGPNVVITATYDGTTTRIVRVAADDHGPIAQPPNPGAAGVTWTLADAKGLTIASGTVADPTAVTAEFADDGTGAPFDTHETGMLDLRVPYVAGSTLTLAPAAASGTSGGAVTPQGICVNNCPAPSAAPVPAPSAASADAGVPGLKKIVDKGSCAPFNILLVSEGFQSGEMSSFEQVAQNVGSGIIGYKGYSDAAQDINVWVLEVASVDSGITDPGCMPTDAGTVDRCDTPIPAKTRDTAFGATFGDNIHAPRRAITVGAGHADAQTALANAIHAAKADVTGFLVNDPGNLSANYGGSANISGRRFTTSTYDAPGSSVVSVAAHETGHALFGLQDEYSYGDTAATCTAEAAMSPPGGRGPFPLVNVTNTASPAPWASVQPAAPIVGAYYCTASFYRPETSCLMKELSLGGSHNEFCSVCLDHLKTVVKAKETFVKCSCGGTDAGAPSDASSGAGEGGLVSPGGALVCPSAGSLVQQASASQWWEV